MAGRGLSCPNCGARLLPQAEVCDLCGTVVDASEIITPDWIDPRQKREPAFRTLPDPVLDPEASLYPIDPIGTERGRRDPSRAGEVAQAERIDLAPVEDFFDGPTEEAPPPMGESLTPAEVLETGSLTAPPSTEETNGIGELTAEERETERARAPEPDVASEPAEASESASATLETAFAAEAQPAGKEDADLSLVPGAGAVVGKENITYCSSCGSANAAGYRFCSSCGSRIVTLGIPPQARELSVPAMSEPVAPPAPRLEKVREPQAGSGRLLAVIVGASVLLVVSLYMISVFSSQRRIEGRSSQGVTEAAPAPPPPPLTGDARQRAQTLRSEIAELDGADRLAKQRELVGLYIAQRRLDLAAGVQQDVAEATNTESEWIRAGNLWYDWMESRTGPDKADHARRAIAAYQRALEINPANLDVRTDMAIAYLYDPSNSMEAIRQTNEVLDRNPNHIQANFNRGIMLMQVNRIDQAIEQFEKVKTLIGDANSPIFQRAEQALVAARNLQSNGTQ